MIFTQSITAWADVSGVNFRLTHATVERGTGRTVGHAKLKGVVDSPDDLFLGADTKIYVSAISSDEPWNEDLSSFSQVFGGEAHSAKQNEKGEVVIEAYDSRDQLQSQKVQLEVENPTYTRRVLKDLLEEEYFGGVTSTLSEATMFKPYLAPASDFPGTNTQRPWRFGNANRGLPLVDAIEDLLQPLGGMMFVDREGRPRFQPYPEHTEWETPFITKVNSGEETQNAERIIFQGSGVASELGQGASYVYNKTSIESASEIQKGDEEPAAPEKTLQDQNITTQEEADHQSYNESVNQHQNRDMGTVTIIGNADLELYDHIIIPELEYDVSNIEQPLPNDLQAGKFKVDGLTHTIDASEGFLTKVQLSPPIKDTYEACTVASSSGFEQPYLDRYSNSVVDQKVSGQDDSSGFLDLLTENPVIL